MQLSVFGIDGPIALTLINRAWTFLSGPLTIAFIVGRLSPAEQGFYYTFISVLGLQVFFELGLGFVILQTVSHLIAGVSFRGGMIAGDDNAAGRIGTLLISILKWYAVLALAFFVAVLIVGFWMFSTAQGQALVNWKGPWILVVAVFGCSIMTNVLFSFIEGMGFIAETAFGRLIQSVGAGLVLWSALLLGAHLYALGFMYAASVGTALLWIGLRHGGRLRLLAARSAVQYRIDWRTEIWPFQWRIAASWVSGYLASLAITPIVFHILGPVPAGQIGLSITIASAASLGALAWVSTKSAIFGRLIAERRFDELDALYTAAFRRAIMVAAFAMIAMVIGAWIVWAYLPQYRARILPLPGMAALAVASVFNVQISAQAMYLRAFRREPFMNVSIANGACLVLTTIMTAHFFGTIAVALAYAATTATIAVAWCRPLFRRCATRFKSELA